jgi:hypothetical protein
MRTQSLSALSTFAVLVSLLITAALLSAQQVDTPSSETSDPLRAHAPGSSCGTPISDSPTLKKDTTRPAAQSTSNVGDNQFAVKALTGILDQYRKNGQSWG